MEVEQVLFSRSTSFLNLPKDVVRYTFDRFLSPLEAIAFRSVCRWARDIFNQGLLDRCRGKLYLMSIEQGKANLFDWLWREQKIRSFGVPEHMLCLAACRSGHLTILSRLKSEGFEISLDECFVAASSCNHLHVVQWLMQHACDNTPFNPHFVRIICVAAAQSDSLRILQWVCDVRLKKMGEAEAEAAAKGGAKEVLDWLWKRWKLRTASCGALASSGDVAGLQRLAYLGVPVVGAVAEAAAAAGHCEVLDWMEKEGGGMVDRPSVDLVLRAASGNGQRATVYWALSRGAIPSGGGEEIAGAIRRGRLCLAEEILDFMMQKNVMLSRDGRRRVLVAAAQSGEIDMLKWASNLNVGDDDVDVDVDNTEECLVWCARGGHLDAMMWLMETKPLSEGLILGKLGERMMIEASRGGFKDVMRELMKRGSPLSATVMSNSCSRGDITMAKWLKEMHCPMDYTNAMKEAVAKGRRKMVEWLRENGNQ